MACELLSGSFGKFVQGFLGLMTMATLALKWCMDKSGRTRKQFLMDSFKNCSGAASLHVTNLVFAGFLAPVLKTGDACHWYWIEIMIDTTLGVYVEFFLLMQIISILNGMGCEETARGLTHANHSDDKGEPLLEAESGVSKISKGKESDKVDWCKYAQQVIAWLLVVQLMKAIMVAILVFEAPQLSSIAGFFLNPFDESPKLKLVIVMVLTPVVMNLLQFWLQDNIFVSAAQTAREAAEEAAAKAAAEDAAKKAAEALEAKDAALEEKNAALATAGQKAEEAQETIRRQKQQIQHLKETLKQNSDNIKRLEHARDNATKRPFFGRVLGGLTNNNAYCAHNTQCPRSSGKPANGCSVM